MKITIETKVAATLEEVWQAWITPEDIVKWNAASVDWHTTSASVDLKTGGTFSSRMEAKDGSVGFDFTGTYTEIIPHELIEYKIADGRDVCIRFVHDHDHVTIHETFDAEGIHPPEMQQAGWQAILDNFARHVESKKAPVL